MIKYFEKQFTGFDQVPNQALKLLFIYQVHPSL